MMPYMKTQEIADGTNTVSIGQIAAGENTLEYIVGNRCDVTIVLPILEASEVTLSVRLQKPDSTVRIVGLVSARPGASITVHTLQHHQAPQTTSTLLVKSVLREASTFRYDGAIRVERGAQKIDAYQRNENLLLAPSAHAESTPILEILANDVRCTHGATIGHVDEEQLYYLMARGLPRLEAQRLIVEGFFVPVLDRIPLESVREQLRQVIQRKIG